MVMANKEAFHVKGTRHVQNLILHVENKGLYVGRRSSGATSSSRRWNWNGYRSCAPPAVVPPLAVDKGRLADANALVGPGISSPRVSSKAGGTGSPPSFPVAGVGSTPVAWRESLPSGETAATRSSKRVAFQMPFDRHASGDARGEDLSHSRNLPARTGIGPMPATFCIPAAAAASGARDSAGYRARLRANIDCIFINALQALTPVAGRSRRRPRFPSPSRARTGTSRLTWPKA